MDTAGYDYELANFTNENPTHLLQQYRAWSLSSRTANGILHSPRVHARREVLARLTHTLFQNVIQYCCTGALPRTSRTCTGGQRTVEPVHNLIRMHDWRLLFIQDFHAYIQVFERTATTGLINVTTYVGQPVCDKAWSAYESGEVAYQQRRWRHDFGRLYELIKQHRTDAFHARTRRAVIIKI
jgi:hypothetical protein